MRVNKRDEASIIVPHFTNLDFGLVRTAVSTLASCTPDLYASSRTRVLDTKQSLHRCVVEHHLKSSFRHQAGKGTLAGKNGRHHPWLILLHIV